MSASFIQRLLSAAPKLQPLYDEHIRSNHELLSYVFMGDVTRYVISENSGKTANGSTEKILSFFESELASGEESSSSLISLGFCENLFGEEQALASLRPQMGRRLANAMKAVFGE
jgi:hypothetical protein